MRSAERVAPPDLVARRIEVRGVVQGVGFRPFVWRLAERHGVAGRVRNASGVVEIHAEGAPEVLEAFTAAIAGEAPPLARVEAVSWTPVTAEGLGGFDVEASVDGVGDRLVSADAATCAACLTELFDPDDRRYRYPFINCTDCGPRFTIIEALPYDRERTSMRAFPMCDQCRREYEDPGDRRFHAEPVACPACGPRVSLLGVADADDPIEIVAALIRAGGIVALKGLGGFHLACDATDEAAVARLRDRKRRPDKPFAVMVSDVAAARRWFAPTPVELDALSSWQAPIVLMTAARPLAPPVAPGFARHGVMLPSTPLHHLLLRAVDRPLVMTSGNASDEPICVTNEDAADRLAPIADAVLVHDRDVVARYDDSVVQVRTGDAAPSVMRRARSSAPSPIDLAIDASPTLGTGALLHGAFCLANAGKAFLSQHVGDLDTEESMAAYREALDRFREVFRIEPEIVAHDRHPDFMTTRFAASLGLPTVAVQHHHAHVAATMAEHGLDGEVLGLAFDGLGLGDDGTVWGGELLRVQRGRVPEGRPPPTGGPARRGRGHARPGPHGAGPCTRCGRARRRDRPSRGAVRARRRGRAPDRDGARLAPDQLGGPPVRRGGRDRGRVPIRQLRGAARDAARSGGARARGDACRHPGRRAPPRRAPRARHAPADPGRVRAGRRRRTVPRRVRGADRRGRDHRGGRRRARPCRARRRASSRTTG